MHRFWKNKIGSEVVEMILLFPIFLWLIFFSVFKIWTSIEKANASIFSERYVRNIAIGTSFDNAMDNVARNYSDEYKITKITISNKRMTDPFILIFSEDDDSSTSFGYYVTSNSFDKASYYASLDNDTKNALRTISNTYWDRDTTVTIQVRHDLISQDAQNAFALKYHDPIENVDYDITLGLDTNTESSSSSIVYVK